VRAPAYAAERTNAAAGMTVPDVPIATDRSQSDPRAGEHHDAAVAGEVHQHSVYYTI
jgi:hypothetical protein